VTVSEPKSVPFFIDNTLCMGFATKPVDPWPAITGTVRPATVAAARKLMRERNANFADDTKVIEIESAFYAEHLLTWSIDGSKPTAKAIASLPEQVYNQLEEIVRGVGLQTAEKLLGN
jgi:hypothetical protein